MSQPTRVASAKGRLHEWGAMLEHAPADAVYVGRRMTMGGWLLPRSDWANPFTVKAMGSAEAAVTAYDRWLDEPEQAGLRARIVPELRGKLLICWCPTDAAWCHARNVLARRADSALDDELDRICDRIDRVAAAARHDFGERSIHRMCAEPLMPVSPPTDIVVPVGEWAGKL